MQVDYQKIDDLNAQMTVTVHRADYEKKYRSELLEYKKKASIKGFRKGKTPFGYLEKLFGQEVLTKTVTDLLTESVNTYLQDHDVPFIGQPLPAEGQEPMAFDPKELRDAYVYKFDIGLLPDFEIKGLDEEVEWIDVPVTDAEVDDEWNELLKRQGTYVEVETVDAESRVNMHLKELENDAPKPNGKEHTRRVYVSMLKDEVLDQIVGKKAGDKITFDPNTFLKQGDVKLFMRYYFDIQDETETISDRVEGEVLDISTLKPAEINQELFDKAFEPGKVTSEERARELIRGALKQRNDNQSDAHLRHMLEHKLMDSNPFELPKAFLDRLIGETEKQETPEEQDTPEGEEKPAPTADTHADGFRWHFIKEKLTRKFNIKVTQDEIMKAAADQVYERFGGYMPYDRMREIIGQYLQDKDSVMQLRNSVADTKLFYALKEHIPVVKKETSKEEFKALQESHQHEHHEH
jgi:trigger factor